MEDTLEGKTHHLFLISFIRMACREEDSYVTKHSGGVCLFLPL